MGKYARRRCADPHIMFRGIFIIQDGARRQEMQERKISCLHEGGGEHSTLIHKQLLVLGGSSALKNINEKSIKWLASIRYNQEFTFLNTTEMHT